MISCNCMRTLLNNSALNELVGGGISLSTFLADSSQTPEHRWPELAYRAESSLPYILTLAIVVASIIGAFIIRRHFVFRRYIKNSGIPFVPVTSYISGSYNLLVTSKQAHVERLEKYFQSLGDTFGFFIGEVPFVATKDLDLIHKIYVQDSHKNINRPHVGVTDEYKDVSLLQARDDIWRRTRRAIGSTMTLSKLKLANVEKDVDDCLDNMMASLEKRIESQSNTNDQQSGEKSSTETVSVILDCSILFKNFVMDTFLNVAFDQPDQIDYTNLRGNKLVINATDIVKKGHNIVVVWTLFIVRLTSLIQVAMKLFRINHFSQYLNSRLEIIIEKMTSGRNQLDGDEQRERKKMIHSLLDLYKEEKLTKNELMVNMYFMLMAGWDTTSDSLTALMWQLANNRPVQENLRKELIKDGIDSYYLQCVVKESLRLMPAVTTAREIAKEFKWKGFTFFEGMVLYMPPFNINRDETIWGKDAAQFKPDRHQQDPHHPAQNLTFGLGPRNCVGYNLAMLEIKMVACRILLSYDIRLCESSPKKLSLKTSKDTIWFLNIVQDPVELNFVPLRATQSEDTV